MSFNFLTKRRGFTNRAQKLVDALTPPILRDSRWFCWLLYYPFLKSKTKYFFSFRENTHALSMEEYTSYYQNTQSILERDTDLGIDGLNKLLGCITQSNVLEVGCGTGYLAKALSKSNTVTATDILISNEIREDNPEITFVSCPAEHLPFEDKAFETTVCTHVLEHVLDFEQCVRELRRVTKKELHIIVPLQRPAKYTPDLHVSFFPYPESFLLRIKPRGVHHFQILDGDLYYVEKCDN